METRRPLAVAEDAGPPDASTFKKRLEQIELGKNTIGYMRYTLLVPRARRSGREHPRTPDASVRMPKRRWDTIVRSWRRQLHDYDLHMAPHNRAAPDDRAHRPEAAGAEGEDASEPLERRPDGTYVAQDMPAAGTDFLRLLWGPSVSIDAPAPAKAVVPFRSALLSSADVDAMRQQFCACDDEAV